MAKLKVHSETRLYFWGVDLTKAREELGLSQEEFARKCNWTQQNQQHLELPEIRHHLTFEKRERFKRIGLAITTRS
jgi:predicted transcriptional regulator